MRATRVKIGYGYQPRGARIILLLAIVPSKFAKTYVLKPEPSSIDKVFKRSNTCTKTMRHNAPNEVQFGSQPNKDESE